MYVCAYIYIRVCVCAYVHKKTSSTKHEALIRRVVVAPLLSEISRRESRESPEGDSLPWTRSARGQVYWPRSRHVPRETRPDVRQRLARIPRRGTSHTYVREGEGNTERHTATLSPVAAKKVSPP